jgi:hypothetical protein
MREPVSQAQARIREAVARKRQGKQAALPHHINIDIPRTSFFGLKTTAALGVGSFFKISCNAHASPVFFRYSDGVFACVNFTLKKSPSVFWRPSRFTRCRTKKRCCAWPRGTLDSFLRAIWARTVGTTRRQLLRPVLQTALVRGIFWTRLALTRGQPRARQHRIGGARSA